MKVLLILLSLLCSTFVFAQDISVEELVNKTDETLNVMETLSFFLDAKNNFLSDAVGDTSEQRAFCYMKAMPDGEVYHNMFLSHRQQMYNGDNILNVSMRDSSAVIIDTEKFGKSHIYGNYIGLLIRDELFSENYFNKKLKDSTLIDTKLTKRLFKGEECYEIKFQYEDSEYSKNNSSTFYIRKSDFFPIVGFREYSSFDDSAMHYYELSNIAINTELSNNTFDLGYNVQRFHKIEHYEPEETKELLESGQLAPSFSVKNMQEEDVKLEELKGKVVVLDFWYRSCFPCLKAQPDIERISKEYQESEVVVLGVNSIDTKDEIKKFLKTHELAYGNLYNAKEIVSDYNISSYPVFYIIDQSGKIASAQTGSNDVYGDLSTVIDKLLK